ncbi:MAG: Ricin and poly(3-hydroxybutyrate) depolymerase fusion [Polyangiaceae bacterium]
MRTVDAACLGLVGWVLLLGCGSSGDETDGASTTPSGSGAGASGTGASGSGASGSGASGGAGASTGAGATGGGGGAVASPGCGKASPTGVDADGSITVGGEARSFVLSVPDSYDPDTPMPLVFAWHGAGGEGSLARLYFGVEEASGGAAIFVYPDGLVVQPQNASGWDLESDGKDVALFDALLEQLSNDYCIDGARVFATGHSFGGYMSNTLGCARSSVLRAIAPVAGGGPFGGGCDPGSLSAWLAHGTNDPTVDIAQGESSRDHWLDHASCSSSSQPATPEGCVEYDGCSMERVVWCTHDEGHNWPDLAPDGIWGFFASF